MVFIATHFPAYLVDLGFDSSLGATALILIGFFNIFGVRYVSTLFGVVFFRHQVGAFCGAWLGGFVFDRTGSYNAVWLTALGLSLVAMVIHLVLSDSSQGQECGEKKLSNADKI